MKEPANTIAGMRILIAEDSYLQAAFLEVCITEEGGVALGPYADNEAAIAAITLEKPDAALVDLSLGTDGPDSGVIEALLGSGIPFVVVTGYSQEALPAEFHGLPWVYKPSSAEAVCAALLRALRGESEVHTAEGAATWTSKPLLA